MAANKIKFTQANETPFNQRPLLNMVGSKALTRESDKILKGTAIIPPGIHQGDADFIQAVKMHPDIMNAGPISADISAEQHYDYWNNARKATQSSLSGMHFGSYKATAKCKSLAQTVADFV